MDSWVALVGWVETSCVHFTPSLLGENRPVLGMSANICHWIGEPISNCFVGSSGGTTLGKPSIVPGSVHFGPCFPAGCWVPGHDLGSLKLSPTPPNRPASWSAATRLFGGPARKIQPATSTWHRQRIYKTAVQPQHLHAMLSGGQKKAPSRRGIFQ